MISNIGLYIVLALMGFVQGLLPTAVLPASFTLALNTLTSYVATANQFFPVSTLLITAGSILTFEGIYWGYRLIRWAYQKIPGIN